MATDLKSNRKPHSKKQRPAAKSSADTSSVATGPAEECEQPIWETVVELGAQLSDEDWSQVPEDSSLNYKQHLYNSSIQPA